MVNLSEAETTHWHSLQKGDPEALAGLYRKFARMLHNYGYRLVHEKELVQDSVQDLFVQLWSNHQNLPTVDSVKAYLLVSLRRELLRRVSHQRRFTDSDTDMQELLLPEPSFEDQLIDLQKNDFVKSRIIQAIEHLPVRQREIIFLKYYSALGTQEIAETMGITSPSVYKLIYKALANLKELTSVWEFN